MEKIRKLMKEDLSSSSFVRRVMRKEFAELGFLDEEEKKALGLAASTG